MNSQSGSPEWLLTALMALAGCFPFVMILRGGYGIIEAILVPLVCAAMVRMLWLVRHEERRALARRHSDYSVRFEGVDAILPGLMLTLLMLPMALMTALAAVPAALASWLARRRSTREQQATHRTTV